MLTIGLKGLGALLVLATVLPFAQTNLGLVRSLDFPRLQIACALAAGIALLLLVSRDAVAIGLAVAMAAAFVVQIRHIVPFTPLAPTVVEAVETCEGASLSILVLNVLQSNRDYAASLEMVRQRSPDLVLLLEPDAAWQAAMAPLREHYPHRVERPQDDTYGLLFYSRLPLHDPQIRFLLAPDVPSLRTRIVLPGGEEATFYGIHPRPPHPGQSSAPRDAELVVVAREIEGSGQPTIVAGDLNDVAWSRTTQLFQSVSRLLDPRQGRGLYATFHARWPFMRWPLDHIFFSEHFLLEDMARLPAVGSDHFPILIRLCRSPKGPARQDAPEADAEDRWDARETIDAVR